MNEQGRATAVEGAIPLAVALRLSLRNLARDLKSGDASISALLGDPPEWVLTAKVFDRLRDKLDRPFGKDVIQRVEETGYRLAPTR